MLNIIIGASFREWRAAEEWPPAGGLTMAFFLHADGSLSTVAPAAKESAAQHTDFMYDPSCPVPTVGGSVSAAANTMNPGKKNHTFLSRIDLCLAFALNAPFSTKNQAGSTSAG